MQKSFVLLVVCAVGLACSESPTSSQTNGQTGQDASLIKGGLSGDGAQFLHVDQTGVDAFLAMGVCTFRPDGVGEFNNFLRTNPNGTRYLKIQDAEGTMDVTVFGGGNWSGRGRVNVSWPDYPNGQSFEMTMVGDHDAAGNAALCKYKIANGVSVEAFVKTK